MNCNTLANFSKKYLVMCKVYTDVGLILYVPVNNLSVTSERVFLGWTSTKQGLMCLAQGHNAVTPVRLEPTALRSSVKNSTTEPLRSLHTDVGGIK